MRLWDLPGAKRFIESICLELRKGNCVVIRFPYEVPEGFDEAVESEIEADLKIRSVSATANPLRDLAREFATYPEDLRRITDLLDESSFRSCLVRVRDLSRRNWDHWRDFLRRFAEKSSTRPMLGRSVILVKLEGIQAHSPQFEVGFVDLNWQNVLDEFDLLFFASEHLRDRGLSPIMRSLLAHTVAYVAKWDFYTAKNLIVEPESTILAPYEFLMTMSRDGAHVNKVNGSAPGVVQVRLAKDTVYGLDNRLWRAQAAVLLPWIEMQRVRLVVKRTDEIKRLMRAVRHGDRDPFSLEIGQLWECYDHRTAPRDTKNAIRLLRNARNRLAHQQHMPYDEIRTLLSYPRFQTLEPWLG